MLGYLTYTYAMIYWIYTHHSPCICVEHLDCELYTESIEAGLQNKVQTVRFSFNIYQLSIHTIICHYMSLPKVFTFLTLILFKTKSYIMI